MRKRKWIRHRPRRFPRVPRDQGRSTWAREWRYPACGGRFPKCRCWSLKRPRRGKQRGEKNCKSMSIFIPIPFFYSFRCASSLREITDSRKERKREKNGNSSFVATSKGLIFRFLPKTLAVYKANGDRRIQFTMADCYPPRNEEMTESRTTTNGRVKSS